MATVRETVVNATSQLANGDIPEARLEAEVLIAHVMATDRTHLLAAFNEPFPPAAEQSLASLVERRLGREPLAYLVGWREFYGLRLEIRRGVLIPRQETESLVDEALRLARARHGPAPLIADVGCGSGAIALALAVHLPNATVYAIDNSPTALEVTARNAASLGVRDRVRVLEGDLLQSLPEPVDLIAANPPYVPADEFPHLQPEVLHEPREALDGGTDGLEVIHRLLGQTAGRLRPNGCLLVECVPQQIPHLLQYAARLFPGSTAWAVKDLAGRERVAVVQDVTHAEAEKSSGKRR